MIIKYVVCLFNLTLKYTVMYKSMVKHEKSIEENLKELEEEIDVDPEDEIKRKREELIKLSEDRQFDRDVKAIKKASVIRP